VAQTQRQDRLKTRPMCVVISVPYLSWANNFAKGERSTSTLRARKKTARVAAF
jgi:hypothetical protein